MSTDLVFIKTIYRQLKNDYDEIHVASWEHKAWCVCNCMIVKVNYAVFIANNILLVSMSDSAILLWNVGYRFFGNLKRLHKTWILDTEK